MNSQGYLFFDLWDQPTLFEVEHLESMEAEVFELNTEHDMDPKLEK